jgi:hypothetical protein
MNLFHLASVTLANASGTTLSSSGQAPVMFSYHWLDDSAETLLFERVRTLLDQPLRPGETATRRLRATPAPQKATALRVTLVQEGVAWFDNDGVHIDLAPVALRLRLSDRCERLPSSLDTTQLFAATYSFPQRISDRNGRADLRRHK